MSPGTRSRTRGTGDPGTAGDGCRGRAGRGAAFPRGTGRGSLLSAGALRGVAEPRGEGRAAGTSSGQEWLAELTALLCQWDTS